MKATLVAAAVALVLLALLPAATASTVAPLAGVEPTTIQALQTSALVPNVQTLIVATLEDAATGAGVAGENLSFVQVTLFGHLDLGVAPTNAQGKASVPFTPQAGGPYTVNVTFAGDAAYAPSNTTLTLTVLAASSPPPPLIPPDRAIVLVVVAVVGGVWSTYAFVAYLVLGIRGAGSRSEEDEAQLEERRTMEKAPSDAEASPKRVPGAANTNRAVVALAVAALVLAGASVGLVAVGGLGKTAAYTPQTMEFSITAVPDLRGGGWDSFVPNEVVVHVGDTIKITLYNADTGMAHGFAIDALGIKVDLPMATVNNATGEVIPAVVTVPAFTVTAPGTLIWYCTVYCGDGHSTMTGTLVVLPD